jgi:hypothetical protein
MVTLATALNSIDGAITGYLAPMITNQDITEIVFGTKDRKAPTPPYIRIAYIEDAKCDNTTIGTASNREEWNQPIHIGSVVKELDNPQTGFQEARSLISIARGYLLQNRQFGLPNIVRKVDSSTIKTVPYPFDKKRTLYGAGTILNINFIINNTI